MAANSGEYTIANVITANDPTGGLKPIANTLEQTNELMQVMPWLEGNLVGGNITREVTSMFTPTIRIANEGIAASVNEDREITDTVCKLEDRIEIDEHILEKVNDPAGYIAEQVRIGQEAFGQKMADLIINGDSGTDIREFDGLNARYDALASDYSVYTDRDVNVIAGGGSGADNSSIYVLGLGPGRIHGIYPKNTAAGLTVNDKGKERINPSASSTNALYAHTVQILWRAGLVVNDWRWGVRVCNIDQSALTRDAASGANLIDLLSEAVHRLPSQTGNIQIACGRRVKDFLHSQIMNKSNVNITYGPDPFGRQTTMFMGIPINRVDAIGEAETLVS
jgi:hypothetical protein